MSVIPKETIEVIAQSIGINNLSSDVALSIAPDVEYRIREIMQEAIKCMRHSRRIVLTTDDVDSALSVKNVEPIYGFTSGDPLRFKRAVGHKDLFYIDDKDVDFKDVIEAPLPKAPLDTAVVCHWLAIEGEQPAIPENATMEVILAPSDGKKMEQKDDGLPVDIKLPVKHILSRELRLYFDKISELTVSKSGSDLFKEALVSLRTDPGIHPLVPYFTLFIKEEVSRGLNNFPLLFALMRVVSSLLQNPYVNIENYMHQLMPSVVTCLVAKKLGNRLADNHWELRDFTANLVASICKRFGHLYETLQPRLTRTLVNALSDPKRSFSQRYGAIKGLTALGTNVVRLHILPNLERCMQLLGTEMLIEKQKNEMKRHEAWRVYGALMFAAGQCIYDRLKMFPALPSPPAHAVWRTTHRIVTTVPNKRKASIEQLEEQPPPKKVVTDGPMAVATINSMPSDMEVETRAPTPLADSDMGPSSSSAQTPNESNSGLRGETDKVDKRDLKMAAVLSLIWKDELNSGKLLESLFEQFGESISPFIPTPELSLFL